MPEKKNKESISERAEEYFESAKDKVYDTKDVLERFVKRNPMTSVAIAVGVGAALAIGMSEIFKPRKKFVDKLRDRMPW